MIQEPFKENLSMLKIFDTDSSKQAEKDQKVDFFKQAEGIVYIEEC